MRLLELAAEKRAAGLSWAAVADAVKRKAEVVQRWPTRYPEIWRRLLQAAREQHAQDAGNEALSTLRSHLRSKNEKLSQDAAKKLIDHCPPASQSAATDDVDSYLASCDDETALSLEAALDASEQSS
jgi:hypothetical protein